MNKSSNLPFWRKKYFFPFFSATVVMSMGALIFFLPAPLATQFHETTADQYLSVIVTPEITVELDKFSAISITNSEPPSIELIKGNAYFDDRSTSVGIQTLEINVGDVRLFDLGASFSVETLQNGVRISLTNGQLEMDIGGHVHTVSAGQQVDFDKQRIIRESSIANRDVAPWRR